MRVQLDKIGPDGYDLDQPVTVAWLNNMLGADSPFTGSEDGSLRVRLERLDDAVYVHGRAQLTLKAECSRCLGPVDFGIDTPVEVTLFPRGKEPQPVPDGELTEEDMGIATYENKEIDLSGIVHDEVFLELPMSPICSEACAGLCPNCGVNLNESACDCAPQVDVRWEGLARIKVD